MKNYRVATTNDYRHIVNTLNSGDEQAVLVHSIKHSDRPPFPLLEIIKGPFWCLPDRISGLSLQGNVHELFIADDENHHLEIRLTGDGDWQVPQIGPVQILIRT